MRIAVIDPSLCKPKHCSRECIRFCPLVRTGSEAIKFDEELKRPIISETVCIGCGICVKKCPFKAITIVNLPDELEKKAVHRYGPNAFKLYGLPIVKQGKVLGILGQNGIGKSTILKILSGKIVPNLGRYDNPPQWEEIIRFFRGTELQNYFKDLSNGKIRAVYKPQEIGVLPRVLKGTVKSLLDVADERGIKNELVELLGLKNILDKKVSELSGGELQKLSIALVMARDAQVYLFDEPASFLDVYERLKISGAIRNLSNEGKTIVVVEHDLATLDYMSDYITIVYGQPAVYGIVSLPRSTRVGINVYLKGFLKEENILIRREPIVFHVHTPLTERKGKGVAIKWSNLLIKIGSFTLEVASGEARRGEVIGILGPNAIGKTTFIKTLAGILKPIEGYIMLGGKLKISYKPQFITQISYPGTLYSYLKSEIGINPEDPLVRSEYLKPLGLDKILDRFIDTFSGGELQRAAIVSTLLREADIYLLDEPMAYLDVEQRLIVARLIKRVTEQREATTFVVEHDIVMQDFIADSLMVFTGTPGKVGKATQPLSLRKGMNEFLKDLGITFRRDLETGRPRVNKPG
ncbi:MAG TPA: ribosome biogenesis/translation initiation ATPase RLI, partial [Thermoproteales archaeon]|nr:ribosome biogenesis/translation initiation ATPase RLI [Thermoproteales archaeon]